MRTKELLREYNIIPTTARRKILEIFLSTPHALTQKELQLKINGSCDRATIYRTLNLFLEKNILHSILAGGAATRFTLKKQPDRHPHFRCIRCGDVSCLTGLTTEIPELPEGYSLIESRLLITGICNECNKD